MARGKLRPGSRPRSLELLLLGGVTVLTLLPFTGKAFHIDDTLYLWGAKQIQMKPLDPYGVDVNWYGFVMPMSQVDKNPPLTSYYIAGAAGLLGWSERALHIAFLVPALIVVLGTYLLGKRWTGNPWLAALGTLFTPVFLVSSTNVMSDVLMLAFWVAAVHFWLTGLDKRRAWRLLLSAFLIAVSALSKYYGIALIPLLAAYTLLKERRVTWALAYFLIPVALLGAYQWANHALYGRALLFDAATYAAEHQSPWGKLSLPKALVGLGFTGGCLGAVWLLAPATWPRWTWLLFLTVAGAVAAATGLTRSIVGIPMNVVTDAGLWPGALLLGVSAAGALILLTAVTEEAWKRRDPVTLLLALWILGTFVFATFVNWTTNGRSILPMVPAVGLFLARRVGAGARDRARTWTPATVIVLATSAVLSLAAARADHVYAGAAREAAQQIHDRYADSKRAVWFEGHWGFQYYMEKLGGKAVNFAAPSATWGDILVVPENSSSVYWPKEANTQLIDRIEVPCDTGIATMRAELGAGFYSDQIGPLPFGIGSVPPERYFIFQVQPRDH